MIRVDLYYDHSTSPSLSPQSRLPRIYDTQHNVRNQLHATLRSRDATEITILTAPISNKLPIPMQSSRVSPTLTEANFKSKKCWGSIPHSTMGIQQRVQMITRGMYQSINFNRIFLTLSAMRRRTREIHSTWWRFTFPFLTASGHRQNYNSNRLFLVAEFQIRSPRYVRG